MELYETMLLMLAHPIVRIMRSNESGIASRRIPARSINKIIAQLYWAELVQQSAAGVAATEMKKRRRAAAIKDSVQSHRPPALIRKELCYENYVGV
ncbi:hypothetical protein PUV54_12760 [Hyphococcus flavus]|uniref:Uncharacterized protein n=1 Tax=Hyphococcus flavus TaxID=1866326 RepID=A0AAE9ZIB0_9PROT|nr:hypothetical protein [Hyphococcus flavus]WDI30825.1 hypothetical protein PUV54_12760 [Hyphococcus flavus]